MGTMVLLTLTCSTGIQAESKTHDSDITICISPTDDQTIPDGWAMDSETAIRTAFESLARDFHVNRVWWRGSQVELYDQFKKMRAEAFTYQSIMQWWLYCAEVEKTNQAAIETAHRLGMKIHAIEGIYDFWTSATAGESGLLPFPGEDVLRIEHPEWVPVNKFGTRRQDGPIEYGYPEARAAVASRLIQYVVHQGYDGLCLYTYVENFAHRYDDEFGYNDVVVNDFKKKYGVDIRTEPFDKTAWAGLRGSYFTELLRELHSGLSAHGKKLVIWLDATDSHATKEWNQNVRTTGNIYMDWETWVRESIVDELSISWPGDAKIAKTVVEACKGTNVEVSMFHTYGDLPEDVKRISSGGAMESGYNYESMAGFAEEKTPPPPVESLDDEDPRFRRQWLHLVSRGKQAATVDEVAAMLNDPDLFVRRSALRALEKLNDPAALPAIKSALKDPEHSIRLMAGRLLGTMGDAESIDLLFEVVANGGMFQFNDMVAAPAILNLAAKNKAKVIDRLNDPNPTVRQVALTVVRGVTHGPLPEGREALLKIATEDADRWNRILALGALTRYRDDPQVMSTMENSMNSDPEDVVQTWAAVYLTWLVHSGPARPFNPPPDGTIARINEPRPFDLLPGNTKEGRSQRRVLRLLVDFFMQYGNDCTRTDCEWGWLAVGNAIKAFGSEGPAALESILREGDEQLLFRAWQVIYVPQRFADFVPATEEEDEVANAYLEKILAERGMELEALLQ